MDDASAEQTCRTPTRVRAVAEEDAWRARQRLLAATGSSGSAKKKGRSSASGSGSPAGGGAGDGRHRRRPSGGRGSGGSAGMAAAAAAAAAAAEAMPLPPAKKDPSSEVSWPPTTTGGPFENGGHDGADRYARASGGAAAADDVNPLYSAFTSPRGFQSPLVTQLASSPRAAFGFHTTSGGGQNNAGVRFQNEGGVTPPTPWRSRVRCDSEDQVQVDGGSDRDTSDIWGGEVEAFASALREEFERKILVTATEGLRAASERAAASGRVLLEDYRSESERETRRLEEDLSRLRAQVTALETANGALTTKAGDLGERLSALHARVSKGSASAKCFRTWRKNATRARADRSKNALATENARRKLVARTFCAWRNDTRLRINSRGRKEADLKLHAISKEIIGRYEAELSSTRACLDEANKQIALEKERQREMEEGMRRTLLRGMSAMNMEAMTIITNARDDGVEDGFSMSDGTRYSTSRTASSGISRAMVGPRHRISEECPRPLEPPRPAIPSSR